VTQPHQVKSPVTVTFFGHCAFLWETAQGFRVLADPYRNQTGRYWFTRQFPDVICDVGLITHAHFDHDAADRLPEAASLIRTPSGFHQQDLAIQGVLDLHAGRSGVRGMANVMFLLETGGIRFLHMGDNRADWPDSVSDAVGPVDVLMVTVDDSCHLLSYQEVDSVVDRVNPRVVIPMHYRVPDLMPESCGLKGPRQWLATQPNVKHLDGHCVTLTSEDLPSTGQVWVFQPSPASLSAPRVEP
jgi:L-ascorbate metabolism protein UlaG (beta-lactamase superfamily)